MRKLLLLVPLLCLFALPSHASCSNTSLGNGVTCVTSGNAANGTNDCTVTINVTSGNFVVAVLASTSTSGTLTISDTNSNVYSSTGTNTPFLDGGSNANTQIWVGTITTNNATDAIDMHDTNSTNNLACAVAQFSGITATVDQSATGSYSATTTLTTGTTSSTTQAIELIIGAFGMKTQASVHPTYTAGGSFTMLDFGSSASGSFAAGAVIEAETVSVTGTQTATATSNDTGDSGGGIVVTIKTPGAAANPGTTILPKTAKLPKTAVL